MDLIIPTKYVQKAAKTTPDELKRSLEISEGKTRTKIVNAERLSTETLRSLTAVFTEEDADGVYVDDVKFLRMSRKSPSKLEVDCCTKLRDALPLYFAEGAIKGWVFKKGAFGALYPYCLNKVEYTPRRKHYRESVSLELFYADSTNLQMQHHSVYWDEQVFIANFKEIYIDGEFDVEDEGGTEENESDRSAELRLARIEARRLKARKMQFIKIDALLSEHGLVKETEELHIEYDKQLERFLQCIKRYGRQFWARGAGIAVEGDDDDEGRYRSRLYSRGRYSRRRRYQPSGTSMYVDGKPAKVICDHLIHGENEEKESNTLDPNQLNITDLCAPFGDASPEIFMGKALDDKAKMVSIKWEAPLHPEVSIYHLETESDYVVHCMNLKRYEYRTALIEKLILDSETKDLVNMLTTDVQVDAEDIIADKSQATCIALIGDPGLGKTLTAEVMSENVEKPLYKVQAATLGLTAEELESSLKEVMDRAQKWDAVLLIDEANAYVHKRGYDLRQNAIVGVFLRLMESYKGILILTTNKTGEDGFDIDDAILNRCAAVVHFNIPPAPFRLKIWTDQRAIRNIKIEEVPDSVLKQAALLFHFSGRSIRNLLGLTARYSRRTKKPISLDMLKNVSKYIPKTREEKLVEEVLKG